MAEALYRQIGERIRRARELAKMSQDDLARELGYNSSTTISYYEAGMRKVSIADLARIARLLGLPMDYFVEVGPAAAVSPAFRLRATTVRPSARNGVDSFLSFAQKNGSQGWQVPSALKKLRPGLAADRVLGLAKVHTPPVNPRDVAHKLGVQVFDWDFPDEISGIYVSNGLTACIGVNDHHPHKRQRFTIAHELGHLVYAEDQDLFVDFTNAEFATQVTESKQQEKETRANQFAADLLMPKEWIRQDVGQGPLDVTVLAKRYEVSEQSLWFRLINLKLVHDHDVQ